MSFSAKKKVNILEKAIAQKLVEKNLISAWWKIFDYLKAIKVSCSIKEFDNESELH